MKTAAESKLRRIIREELDFYFTRLEKKIVESKNIVERIETPIERNDESLDRERSQFRKKFGGLMGAITENMDSDINLDSDMSSDSILNTNVLDSLESNSKTRAVHKALTKDYSALLKKLEK